MMGIAIEALSRAYHQSYGRKDLLKHLLASRHGRVLLLVNVVVQLLNRRRNDARAARRASHHDQLSRLDVFHDRRADRALRALAAGNKVDRRGLTRQLDR